MADHNYSAEITRLGIPDKIIEHGEQPQLWSECGYDFLAIEEAARLLCNVNPSSSKKVRPAVLN